MNVISFNQKIATAKPGSRPSSRNLESLSKNQPMLSYLSDFGKASSANRRLLLEKITGAVLSGIGVFTLVIVSLLCGSLLFQGPLIIEILVDQAF
jgi:hypothetical protein